MTRPPWADPPEPDEKPQPPRPAFPPGVEPPDADEDDDNSMSDRPRCPNCGEVATDSYETGASGFSEWDCQNDNCLCMVFKVVE